MRKYLWLLISFFTLFCNPAFPASDELRQVIFNNFSDGWNTRNAETTLKTTEFSDVKNFDLDTIGALVTRKGSTKFNQVEVGNLLHDFNATTNWSGSTDTANIATNSSTYKEYDNSLEWDKTGTSEAFSYVENTSLSLDLSDYDNKKLQVIFHIPDVTNVDTVFVRVGSGASDYNEYVSTQTLTTGWNIFTITSASPTTTGGTIDWANIDRLRVGVNFDAAANTLNNMKADAFMGIPETSLQIRGLHSYYQEDGDKFFLTAAGTNVYRWDTDVSNFIPIYTSFTAGNEVCFVTYKDLVFFCNGVDANQKFDGTSVTKMGIATPGSAPTPAGGAAGALTGVYMYKVSFKSANHESNASVASSSVNVTSKKIDLSSIPTSADSQVTSRIIYRTKAGGATYFKVTEIADNTTTTYTDNTADTALGNEEAPDFQEPPPVFKYMVTHKNYMFGVGDPNNKDFVYVSKLATPEGWDTSEEFFRVQDSDGDTVTGMAVFLDAVVIAKKRSLFVADADIYSGENEDVDLRKVNTNQGTTAHRTMHVVGNLLLYANEEGTFNFQGVAIDNLQIIDNIKTDNISFRIQPTMKQINEDMLEEMAGTYFDDKYLLAAAFNTATQNDYIFVYYPQLGAWSKYEGIAATVFEPYRLNNEELLYFGGYDGFIRRLYVGTNDDGTAISYSVTTPYYDLNRPNQWKRGKYFYLMGKSNGDFDINTRYYMDYGSGVLQLADVDPGGATWGAFTWGDGTTWGGAKERTQPRLPITGMFNHIRFKIDHDGLDETYTLYGIELLYIPKNYRDYTLE